MKKALFPLLAFVSIFASGCFEMSEEYWFNADGTGKILWEVRIPEELFAMAADMDSASSDSDLKEAENELANDPNVAEVSTREFTEAGMRHLQIEILVKDYLRIPEIYNRIGESSEANQDFGDGFEIIDLGGGRVRFRQGEAEDETAYEPADSSDQDESVGEEYGEAMAGVMFAGKYITVTVHAPRIDSSNGEINDEKNMVIWRIPLVDMMSQSSRGKTLEADLNCSKSFGD